MSFAPLRSPVPNPIVVSAIIEREIVGEKHILLQTRWKPGTEYHDTLEIPAGRVEQGEDVILALGREIFEETGLKIIDIYPKQERITHSRGNGGVDKSICFQSFCCQQQLDGGLPWIGLCFVVRVEDGEAIVQESETRSPQRISIKALEKLLEEKRNDFFTLQVPFLLYYLNHHEGITRH